MPNSVVGRLFFLLVAWLASASAASAATSQFELIGASREWLVVRENVPAKPSDLAACRYPGLDPSQYVGARVLFVRLSDGAKRGKVFEIVPRDAVTTLPWYAADGSGKNCSSPAEAGENRKAIVARAQALGVTVGDTPLTPAVLGAAVAARACLLSAAAYSGPPCRSTYTPSLGTSKIRITIALTAVPEAPDPGICQFNGHRLGAAIQIAGLDFATEGSESAPGGFVDHYDCRGQQLLPWRLYRLNDVAVLLGAFQGTNIADRGEYPFAIVFPTRVAR
jgi:hypothetical protein